MILFFGVQGSGKSAQGQLLAERLSWSWLSTGNLFRQTKISEIRELLAAGKLVSDKMTEQVLDEALSEVKNSDKLALDGFPRTVDQAEWLLNRAKSGEFQLAGVFNLVASPAVAHDRLLKRGRNDDTEKSINERLRQYRQLTLPLLDYFKTNNVKVIDINADLDIEAVHEQIVAGIKSLK